MSFKCITSEDDDNNLVLDISFNSNSSVEYSFLDDGNFSEVSLSDGRAYVRMQRNPEIDKQLERGIVIDGIHHPLYRRIPIKPEGYKKFPVKKPTPIPQPRREIQEQIPNRCPECGGIIIRDNTYVRGEYFCGSCGLVVGQEKDRGPEWRVFNLEDMRKRTRVGDPTTFTIHDKGLSTVIDWRDRDFYGRKISGGRKIAQIRRMRWWQRRIRISDASERNLAHALSEINRIGNKLDLSKNVLEEASKIYRKALKKHLTRGRSIQGVAAGAVYMACRKSGLPRSLDEITKVIAENFIGEGMDISRWNEWRKEVARNYRFLLRELDYSIRSLKPNEYVSKFSNQLGLSGKTESVAYKIVNGAKKYRLTSGRDPVSIAAAGIYIASILMGERETQREIAEIARITEVTLRNRYQEMAEKLLFEVHL